MYVQGCAKAFFGSGLLRGVGGATVSFSAPEKPRDLQEFLDFLIPLRVVNQELLTSPERDDGDDRRGLLNELDLLEIEVLEQVLRLKDRTGEGGVSVRLGDGRGRRRQRLVALRLLEVNVIGEGAPRCKSPRGRARRKALERSAGGHGRREGSFGHPGRRALHLQAHGESLVARSAWQSVRLQFSSS